MERQTLIDRYFAAWNATDADDRRTAIAAVWHEDGHYVDPVADIRGHAALDAMIGGFQAQFSNLVFTQSGSIDEHHGRLRFAWELAPEGGDVVAAGTDVAVLDTDGRMTSVTGFFDMAPALATS